MPDERELKENGSENPLGRTAKKWRPWRILLAAFGLTVLLVIAGVVFFKSGAASTLIESQFRAKLGRMGLAFRAEEFRLELQPLQLILRNAEFDDKQTGEKILFIRDARIALTVDNLLAWQIKRDVSVQSTEIDGAEVWITFDENGRSNFANLVEDTTESNINLKYDSVNLNLRGTTVHFGDVTRRLEVEARNVSIAAQPVRNESDADLPRFSIDASASDSIFAYDDRRTGNISVKLNAVVDAAGGQISLFRVESAVATAEMTGQIRSWSPFRYDLTIESNSDLAALSSILPVGASLTGKAGFSGTINGEGEQFSIKGTANSGEITAGGIYLKGLNVSAAATGNGSAYEANGTAIAELLTAGDFKIEFPRLAGNVRGTGSDFRWLGELQAIAVRSKAGTIMGLYLKDALAELKDREFSAQAGSGLARQFDIAKTTFRNLRAEDLSLAMKSGGFLLSAPNATADLFKAHAYEFRQLAGRKLSVRNQNRRTDVSAIDLRADSAAFGDTKLSGVSADTFDFADVPERTNVLIRNLRARYLRNGETEVNGLYAPGVAITDNPAATYIESEKVTFDSLTASGASLGSVNVAGVRLTIRNRRIEGRTADIDAGDVKIAQSEGLPEGGTLQALKLANPVFLLEPSGRYRASADMSIGGGILGSLSLGSVSAAVTATNEKVVFDGLQGNVMEGEIEGSIAIALRPNEMSNVTARFKEVDLTKLAAIGLGNATPVSGSMTGEIAITFPGTDFRSSTGSLDANLFAKAASSGDAIPLNGNIRLRGTTGLFNVENARISSNFSTAEAAGRFDLAGSSSDLEIKINSSNAAEIERLARIFVQAPGFISQLDDLQVGFSGRFALSAKLSGNITDPDAEARLSLEHLFLRQRDIGAITTNIIVDRDAVRISDGKLTDNRGTADFAAIVPRTGENNISLKANLAGLDSGNLIAALPIELPELLRDLTGKVSGRVEISGLPDNAAGNLSLQFGSGTLSGRQFDDLRADVRFSGTTVIVASAAVSASGGNLKGSGKYDRASMDFDFAVDGRDVPLALALVFIPTGEGFPSFEGRSDIEAMISGNWNQTEKWSVQFQGTARDVRINDNPFGEVKFAGRTENAVLNSSLTAVFDGRPQVITATINFADRGLPLTAATTLDGSPLEPYFSIIPQLRGISIGGTGTGQVSFGGNLAQFNDKGERRLTIDNLAGIARFSKLDLRLQDTVLSAVNPVEIRFSPAAIDFVNASFAGSGSNVSISGRKAFGTDTVNNLQINGRMNLAVLNAFPQISATDTFFGGFADIGIRITGPNNSARLSGTASLENAAVATFVGTGRVSFERLQGRILFTSNQAQLEGVSGYLGGGKFAAEGGAVFGDTLQIEALRLGLEGTNVTVPLPTDFTTTGDANIEVSGRRNGGFLALQISGRIRARRSIYTRNIELANIVGGRRENSLSGGRTGGVIALFDLTIEGRDALVIKNNIADLTASAVLRLTGTTDNPQLSGRITATGGTLFFRNDRYVIQRGVLEFPPDSDIDPNLFLQAETEIKGYQIFVNLSGRLSDTDTLNAAVRSVPALPTQDVLSLITTGSLANTESGLPSIAQTGLNTAAEVLTDSIINNPVRKATDRLFGLNVFEIDPIISGERLNPSARLTVGRQINNNLRVTYATNLSQDQNQVVALEYRISNKLSVIAQYEQRALSNVTRNRDNFSIEVRFRRRF